jgi:hypothetical protein
MNKTKPKKFTFKNEPKGTGLMAVGAGTPNINIRLAGANIGYINFNDRWNAKQEFGIRIHLVVPSEPTPDRPCPWKWGVLTKQFDSGDEAKAYLNENFEKFSKIVFIREYIVCKNQSPWRKWPLLKIVPFGLSKNGPRKTGCENSVVQSAAPMSSTKKI